MKPIIYFLDDKNGSGKPRLMRGLISQLQNTTKKNQIIFYPNELINDVLCVMDVAGLKVGMMSHENTSQSASNLLSFFADKGCDLLFCTSINPDELNKSVANLVADGMVQSVYLKSIWSSSIKIDRLLDYEISKLIEILQIHIDERGYDTDISVSKSSTNNLKVG